MLLAGAGLGLGHRHDAPGAERSWLDRHQDYPNLIEQGGAAEPMFGDVTDRSFQNNAYPWLAQISLKYHAYTISDKDNLSQKLNEMGVSKQVIAHWIDLAQDKYDIHRVKPGQSFGLWYDDKGQVMRFEFNINSREQLVITRLGDDFRADRVFSEPSAVADDAMTDVPVPAWTDPASGYHFYRGKIHKNFYNSALDAGMTPGATMVMIKIFSDVNFGRDLREGDRFSVLTGPGEVGWDEGPILAARVEVRGKPHYMYRYEEGKSFGYYDDNGTSTKRSNFLCPIKYRQISSVFTFSRFHPILHYYRPHLGVDFAAPAGTPIVAAADGTVKSEGRNGGFGNSITLSHSGAYETMYNHMSGFGSGIREGKPVKQGQVIGYCGTTGLSTGPHLDYRIFSHGTPINPLKITSMAGDPVKDKASFKKNRLRMNQELDRELPFGPPRPFADKETKAKTDSSAGGD
jgi:murein DD-endopeptidase MepM/ murein hydrolase activator NlpD